MLRKPHERHVAMLWKIMAHTGNGYRRHSTRNTGIDDDRRKDKLQAVQGEDEKGQLVERHVAREWPESKLERKARHGRLTLRG